MTTLEPVVVTATRLPEPLGDVPASISVVDRSDIQDARQTVGLDESLARVPGVFIQNSDNFAQDLRIQIRGFGTRAAFGTREIKILVDGLPLTLADGQTEIDDIDPGAINHIEVLRGPASSLYGNASGGVIQLFTADAPAQPSAEVRLTGGSFGLGKYQITGGGRRGRVSLFVAASYLQLDGFRAHSATQSNTLTSKLRYRLDDRTDVTLLITGVDSPIAEDPGALTRAEADANPRQARSLNARLDAGEAVRQGRVGLVGRHQTDGSELSIYAYTLYRDFDNRLPILASAGDGVVTFHRISPGAGARYAIDLPLWRVTQRLMAGIDVQHQEDERRRYANLDGQRGALGLHQTERVTSVGPYARDTIYLRDDLELSAGLRYDSVRFAVNADFPSDSGASGSRTMDAWSPAGGVRYSPRPWLSLFGNVGTAFQVPTTTELGNPDGPGFNPSIKPQTATSYELGAHVERSERLHAGVSGFYMDINDELIPFESPSGRTVFRNAGASRRYGSELDWQAQLYPGVRWSAAITVMRAAFGDYATAAGRFDGNDEPGIPPWHVYQELRYQHPSGVFAAVEASFVDRSFADDANTARSNGYTLVNLRGGYTHAVGRWTFAPFVGFANLTDAAYDGTVRLNAVAGRYYEPAPGFNVYGGVAVNARL